MSYAAWSQLKTQLDAELELKRLLGGQAGETVSTGLNLYSSSSSSSSSKR